MAHEPWNDPVAGVRAGLGLSRRDFARLAGLSERAITRWKSGERLSGQSLQRIVEVRNLQQEMLELMEPAEIRRWLVTPNRIFGELKSLEVIERGEIHKVWRTIFQLQEGVAS
jgi:transcriptional regulator with XRE-family HTH domain